MDTACFFRGGLPPSLPPFPHPPASHAARPSAPAGVLPFRPLRGLRPAGAAESPVETPTAGAGEEDERSSNWVMSILRVGAMRDEEKRKTDAEAASMADDGDRCVGCCGAPDDEGEEGCYVGEDGCGDVSVDFDRKSFSRLLQRVPLSDARLYAKMSYLGSLAYSITKIKPKHLSRYDLRFVTSSLEEREKSREAFKDNCLEEGKPINGHDENVSSEAQIPSNVPNDANNTVNDQTGLRVSPAAAYEIAASAASYLQSYALGLFPFRSSKKEGDAGLKCDSSESWGKSSVAASDEASFVVTTNSVTAMVAAEEKTKQAVVEDLNSPQSAPCEWFICDDEQSSTRYFVIQGSETLASWQANLLFEPVQFEGFSVSVHRGIYEAAKGMYRQMLPFIRSHLRLHGTTATFRFTGHSLGGSLSMLVNLMLLIRGEAPASSLLPVITFGAPCIMCGGDQLLCKLGLPSTHVQSVIMHRDIVPRAFSCHYPGHVANILKAINGKFRSHPCLNYQKLLYGPIGRLIILQPEEKFSPHHDLLPTGSGLYLFGSTSVESKDSELVLRAALFAFFNTPHPLEILSDRNAYGGSGMIYRDHDMNSYLISVRAVVREQLKHARNVRMEKQRLLWRPLVFLHDMHQKKLVGLFDGESFTPRFSSAETALKVGRETFRQLGRLVVSQPVRLLVVLLLPARFLVLGAMSVFGLN